MRLLKQFGYGEEGNLPGPSTAEKHLM